MKLCSVCHRCYNDVATFCLEVQHGVLRETRPGSREIADKYRLNSWLREEICGDVYSATKIDSNKTFTIEVINFDRKNDSPDVLKAFLEEASRAAKINHPNVIPIFDYGVLNDNELFVVIENNVNQTLREYIDAGNWLPATSAIKIARRIADGLEAIHQIDLVHRALNLDNIVTTFDDKNQLYAKIQNLDLGGIKQRVALASLKADAVHLNALKFMSPEQCAGAGQTVDKRTDIYSLGLILYTLLSGKPPFEAANVAGIVRKQIHEEPAPLENLHNEIRALLMHTLTIALQKSPAERLQTSATFARRLRHLEYITAHSPKFQETDAVVLNGEEQQIEADKFETPNLVSEDSFEQPQSLFGKAKIMAAAANFNASQSNEEKNNEIQEINQESISDSVSSTPETTKISKVQSPLESAIVEARSKNIDEPMSQKQQPLPVDSQATVAGSSKRSPRNLFLSAGLAAAVLVATIIGVLFLNRQTSTTTQPASQEVAVSQTSEQPMIDQTVQDDEVIANPVENGSIENQSPATVVEPSPLIVNEAVDNQPVDSKTKANNVEEAKALELSQEIAKPIEQTALNTQEEEKEEKVSERLPDKTIADDSHSQLNTSLNQWVSATNARNIEKQMDFYAPRLNAYYLSRNTSQALIRAEKNRVFAQATDVDIQTTKPEITMAADGQTAKMRFRKKYQIKSNQKNRNGEVLQELQWVRSNGEWKIVSERDLKVVQ